MDPLENLAKGIQAFRPVVAAKDFDKSSNFYADFGFKSRLLARGLIELTFGSCSFPLQDYNGRITLSSIYSSPIYIYGGNTSRLSISQLATASKQMPRKVRIGVPRSLASLIRQESYGGFIKSEGGGASMRSRQLAPGARTP